MFLALADAFGFLAVYLEKFRVVNFVRPAVEYQFTVIEGNCPRTILLY
jgi:hypothetical protein